MALIELTRVYKDKKTNTLKTQPITVNSDAIETIKPSNRLGYPEHRATIILVSGTVLDLADIYSSVVKAVKGQ
jgi:hypothetical protein